MFQACVHFIHLCYFEHSSYSKYLIYSRAIIQVLAIHIR